MHTVFMAEIYYCTLCYGWNIPLSAFLASAAQYACCAAADPALVEILNRQPTQHVLAELFGTELSRGTLRQCFSPQFGKQKSTSLIMYVLAGH